MDILRKNITPLQALSRTRKSPDSSHQPVLAKWVSSPAMSVPTYAARRLGPPHANGHGPPGPVEGGRSPAAGERAESFESHNKERPLGRGKPGHIQQSAGLPEHIQFSVRKISAIVTGRSPLQ